MTPQYILKASLCREPHCASNPNWKERAADQIEGLRYAAQYAEPGYSTADKGILFADWNYFPSGIGSVLERAGYATEWSDEWTTCDDCGRAVRTSADCYAWQPSYVMVGECTTLCVSCLAHDAVEWLKSLENNPRTACNVARINLADYGYVRLEGQFESGWHPCQTDNPIAIYDRLKDRHSRILFRIDEVSQFYTTFSVWVHMEYDGEPRVKTAD